MSAITRNGHKFNARRTKVDGYNFASHAESARYLELKMLEKAGEIESLELQPSFDLYTCDLSLGERLKQAARMLRGGKRTPPTRIKVGTYRADFRYRRKTLSASENDHFVTVIEDVKSEGTKTALYRWKKKHTEAQFGITITEVYMRR